jgi:hypothetical protein
VDHIGLNQNILTNKVARIRIVSQNAADLRRREEKIFRAFFCENPLNLSLIRQVQLLIKPSSRLEYSSALSRRTTAEPNRPL